MPSICSSLTGAAVAAATPAVAQDRLTVGLVERPPFAIRTPDGAWQDVAVDLWRMVAEREGLAYDYVALEADDVAGAVAAERVDLALPVDATAALEQALDLSQPFHTATLGVAEARSVRLWGVVEGLLSWQFLNIVLGLSALLLVVGGIVWLLERGRNSEMFSRSPLPGLGDGFWWAGVTLTTIGYGDKAPATFAGRAVAMLWMLVGLAVSASLTAALVSAVDLAGEGGLRVPEDLRDKRVGALSDTTAAAYLEREGVAFKPFARAEVGLEALGSGDIDSFVGPAPTLRWVRRETSGPSARVVATTVDPHYAAVALPTGSPLREALDRAILTEVASEAWWRLVARYLPEE